MPHQKSSQTLKPPLKQREYGLSLIEMATVLAIAGVLILIIQIAINGYLKRANSINLANSINEVLDNNGKGFFNEVNTSFLSVKNSNNKEVYVLYTGDSSSIDKDIIKTRLYSSYGVLNNNKIKSIAGGYWEKQKNDFSSCSSNTNNCMFFYKKITKNGNGNGNGKS